MSSARTVPMSYCQDWWDHVSERCTSVQRYSRELMLSKNENISVLSNGQNLFSVYCVPAGFSGLSLRTTSFLNWKKWWMTSEPQHPSKEVLRTPTWSPYHLKTWRRESSRLWEDTTGRWGRHRRCRFYPFSHINVTWCVDLTVRTRLICCTASSLCTRSFACRLSWTSNYRLCALLPWTWFPGSFMFAQSAELLEARTIRK